MNAVYQNPREETSLEPDCHPTDYVVDSGLRKLKHKIQPGRSRVFADVDLSYRLRVNHLPCGHLEINVEDVPDLKMDMSTLNKIRETSVIIFGPHLTAQDDLAWRGGDEL